MFLYDATLRVPVDHGGPRHSGRPRRPPPSRAPSTCCRRCSTTPASAAQPTSMAARFALPPRGHGMERCAGVRRVALPTARARLGAAPCLAHGPLQFIDAPRAELYDLETTRRRRPTARASSPRQRRDAAAQLETRSCRRPTPAAAAAVDPETAERLRRARLRQRRRRDRRAGAAPRDPKDGIAPHAAPESRDVRGAHRSRRRAIRELTRVLAEDPGTAHGAPHPRRRLRAGRTPRPRDRRSARRSKRRPAHAEDAVVLGDNLRFAGRLRRPPRCSSARPATTRTSRSRGCRSPKSASQERTYAEAARPTNERARARPRSHRGAARPRRPGAPPRGHRRRRQALRPHPRARPGRSGRMTKLGVVRMRDRPRRRRRSRCSARRSSASRRTPRRCCTWPAPWPPRAAGGGAAVLRALDAASASTMALNGMAFTKLQLGDAAGAADAFKRSLKLDADQPEVAQALRELRAPRS